ncbi:general substrate transporter [Xylogone sp. PMI_703]|nr:general substrate transporter [Xylogone sp. PMI_703]
MQLPDKTRVFNWYISLVASACMVLYGYDASVYNSVQGSKHWVDWFNDPDTEKIGAVNTAYTVGAIVAGWFFGGPLADRLGRRWGMGIGCFLTIIATFIQTFSPKGQLGCFIAGRVIIGLGQGIALTAGPVYIGELAPPQIRGKIMAFWQLFYSVGSFIAYWINYACSLHRESLGEWDWKMVVIFQMLVPIIILALLPFIPETPRWYIQHGQQVEKARQALRQVRPTEQEVEDEILSIREALEFEKEAISSSYTALWKDRSVRKRLLLAFVLNIGQQLTGQGTLNTYSTAIYKKVFTDSSTIALINALNATFGIIFTLNAAWTVDRFGRKFLFIVGALGMAVCMLCVSLVGLETPTLAGGAKSKPVGISIVFLLFLFILFYKPSWGATVWIWTSEVFSMNVRAQAVGMCSQMQNVANSIFQQFFPTFLAHKGFKTFFFFFAVNILLAVFVWFFIPETRKVALEEIDVLFGGSNHVEKGGDLLHVEDAHHAHVGVDHIKLAGSDGAEAQQVIELKA